MANISSVQITSNVDEVRKALPEVLEKALTEIGIEAEAHAKEIITEKGAVDTGLLRNSIAYAVGGKTPTTGAYKNTTKKAHTYKADKGDGKGSYNGNAPKKEQPCVYLGTNVEYAPYIELGARGKPPRAFLKPATEDFRDEYKEIVEDNLKNG